MLQISQFGLQPQEQIILRTAANLLTASGITAQVVTDLKKAQITLLTTRHPKREELLEKAKVAGTLLIAVVDEPDPVPGYQLIVVRPLRVHDVKDAIYEIYQNRFEKKEKTKTTNSLLKPESLLGAAIYVHETQSRFLVRDSSGNFVVFDGRRQRPYSNLDAEHLVQFAKTEPRALTLINLQDQPGLDRQLSGGIDYDLDQFIWLIAPNIANEPRLLFTQEEDPVLRLIKSPRFPQQYAFPEYIRLAAMLSRLPQRPSQLQISSRLPIRQIYTFCNLMMALGLLRLEFPIGAGTSATRRKGGFLSRLLKRFA